jgi:glutamate racemase
LKVIFNPGNVKFGLKRQQCSFLRIIHLQSLEATQQLSLLKLQKLLFICCNTFSGLAVMKLFVQTSHCLEIKKLVSKIKKITREEKIQNVVETQQLLASSQSTIEIRYLRIENVFLSYNLLEHYFSSFL